MDIISDGKEYSVESVMVDININLLTRHFIIKNQSEHPIFQNQDRIKIYHKNKLVINGIVEYINLTEKTNVFIYMGRNDAGVLLNSSAIKTYQFTQNQDLKAVLEEIVSPFDIKVEGSGFIPLNSQKVIEVGNNIGSMIALLANNSGQRITSDANGSLVILEDSIDLGANLEYGENVISRSFTMDSSDIASNYMVTSQSDIMLDNENDPSLKNKKVDIKANYGEGAFAKVFKSPYSLNENECQKLSEFLLKRDLRENITYIANIDPSYDFDLNSLISVKDNGLGINQKMRAFSKKITFSKRNYRVSIGLQNND